MKKQGFVSLLAFVGSGFQRCWPWARVASPLAWTPIWTVIPTKQELANNPPTDPNNSLDTPTHVIDSDGDGCSDYGETHLGHCDGNPHTSSSPPVTLTGAVSIGDNLVLDRDTSDPHNSYREQRRHSARRVPSQCPIRARLADSSATPPHGTDQRDVFLAQMAAGQSATLLLADPDSNDFDLYLYDETGSNTVDSSEGVDKAEQVTAPDNGTYLIEVRGYSVTTSGDAGGLYSLLVGESLTTSLIVEARRERLTSLHPFVEGEVLVKYDETIKSARAATQKTLGLDEINDGQNSGGFHRLRLTPEALATQKTAAQARAVGTGTPAEVSPTIAAMKALRRQKGVECAEPNYIRRASAVPNDEFYGYQWHYRLIGLPDAWDITTGSSSVIVAVIDTGVALGHPDLAGQTIAGYDFISDIGAAMDGNGIDSNADDPGDSPGFGIASSYHGTHVSGTIAARTNNGIGVAGIARNTRIMPLRVLGRAGEGSDYDIAQAIRYAARLSNDSGTLPARGRTSST